MNVSSKIPMEKTIVTKILKWLNSLPGCYAIKTHGSQYGSGEPDIVGVICRQAFVFEVKRPEIGKVTKLQEIKLLQWRKAGAIAEVVTSLEQVKEIFVKEGINHVS